MPRFYTRNEVQQHCTEEDALVIARGNVLVITDLIQRYGGTLAQPLIRAAGTDISHLLNSETGDMKTCIDPVSGLRTYAQPDGRFVHCPTIRPDSKIDLTYDTPWWLDERYVVGQLTQNARMLTIVNVLTNNKVTLEVCAEETLQEILENRYLAVNAHANSYTWKRHTSEGTWVLDMNKTLEENGISDETADFEKLGLTTDYYIPAVHLYFNDDLTVA